RTARCEAAFVILSAANQNSRPKAMHKTSQREVYKSGLSPKFSKRIASLKTIAEFDSYMCWPLVQALSQSDFLTKHISI
ncbi:MAG: hypothetical protein ABMA02_09590, partial [Saprospiraceae bacterium]